MLGSDHRFDIYQAADTRHAVLACDLGCGQIAVFTGEPAAHGPAAMDTSPIAVLDTTAALALRDDLTAWASSHASEHQPQVGGGCGG